MKIIKKLRSIATGLALSMTNVKNDVLTQKETKVDDETKQESRHMQGTLADSLVRGELTQEVKNLRWRMYKILDHASNLKINSFDENGNPVVSAKKTANINVDPYDDYEPILSMNNLSASEPLIEIERNVLSRFDIENYITKIIVRKVNEDVRLIDLYVNAYDNPDNFTTKLFINEINKIKNNGDRNNDIFNFISLSFITYNAIGSDDLCLYKYENFSFDKIVNYNGSFVIKLFCTSMIEGEKIIDKYIEETLEEKYKNKAKK